MRQLRVALIVFLLAGIAACAGRNTLPPDPAAILRTRVAETYGLAGFSRIDQLKYTFNVDLGDKQVRRSWVWEPKLNRVTLLDPAGPYSYNRKELSAAPTDRMRQVDAWFVNDQYWLLFPFHLEWDKDAKVEDLGPRPLPMGNGSARLLRVSYPPGIGYTPGDVYELFLGPDDRLVQWIYRRGGSPDPTRISTWDDHRLVGPILLSLDHRGPDGKFRVWFSDVALRTGSAGRWYTPD